MQGRIVTKFNLEDGREVIFRYTTIEDAEAMANYINTLSTERTYIRLQGDNIPLKDEGEHLRKLVKKIKQRLAVQLLAFCEKKLVAISDIIMDKGAVKHIGNFGITVAKEFRKQGIGKKLMQVVLDEAIKNIPQLKIIVLGVFSDNLIAQKMYAEFGFTKYGSLPEGIMHQNHLDDHIYMYKKL